MSGETFAVAIFLITAVVAAAILVSAMFAIVTDTTGTVVESANAADDAQRSKLAVINTAFSDSRTTLEVWIKNTGVGSVGTNALDKSDLFCGIDGGTKSRYTYTTSPLLSGNWKYEILHSGKPNDYLDSGETLLITISLKDEIPLGSDGYFNFVLANGVHVTKIFT